MSNLSPLEKFIDDIDSEIVLRKRQLTFIKDILNKLDNNNLRFSFIRMSIPEIYAHYEGFLKFCFNTLVDYIKSTNIDNSSLNINYFIFPLVTHLENHLLKQTSKSSKLIEIFNRAFSDNACFLDIANMDKYVLNHDSLDNTLSILGIELSNCSIPTDDLGVLYDRRNKIAHGQLNTGNQFSISRNKDITDSQVNVAHNVWTSDYNCVLETLDIIKSIFIEYIQSCKYRNVVG